MSKLLPFIVTVLLAVVFHTFEVKAQGPGLGYSCNTTVPCQEGTRCATDEICRCPDGQYDDNKGALNGTCRTLTELKVTSFTMTATTNSIIVTWTHPSKSTFISRYDVKWRVAGSSVSYTKQSVGLSTSTTISTGLVSGQAYGVVIDSVDTYTQVAEQSVSSEIKQVRLKPEPPSRITNSNNLDAPNILLNWTAPQNNSVTRYSVQVNGGPAQYTTDSTPSLTLTTHLVPGQYYNITIITISGSTGAPGGEIQSVPYTERIRTMVERPEPPTNVQCPTSPKDRSLNISWTAPSYPNGVIHYYMINVSYTGSLKQTNQTSGPETSFNVEGLYPEQSYLFEVFTVNDGNDAIKTSDASTRKECKTMAALATPPLGLTTSEVQSRHFTVSFSRPSEPNGVLTGYVIYVYRVTDSQEECVQEILVKCSDCGKNYKMPSFNSACSGNNLDFNVSNIANKSAITYIITNLLPYTNYTVRVAGINGIGEGHLATSQQLTTLQEVPQMPHTLQVGDILSTSVSLSWSIEDPRPGPTTITLYLYEVVNSQNNLVKAEILSGAFSLRRYHLSGLEEYWDYYFQVNAGTIIGNVTSNQSSVFRTKASAPGRVSSFAVKRLGYTKAVVSWRIPPPRDRNSYLEKYVLVQNFTDPPDEEIAVLQNYEPVTKTFVVIPETWYSIAVYAMSNESSNNEGERTVKVYYAPPGPPPAPGDKIPNVITTTTGGESSTQTSFVVEIDIDFFGDTTNGAIEFFGIAPCKMGNCEVSFQQGGITDNWRTLPNYQEAKNEDYPLYRATDVRYMQRVQSTLNGRRRKRATKQQFTVGNEDCSSHNASTYCNGPLPADTSFMVIVFVCTRGGCTHTDPYGPYKTKEGEGTKPWVYVVAALCTELVISAVVIFVIYKVLRKRSQSHGKTEESTYTELSLSTSRKKNFEEEAYSSLQQKRIRQRRPVVVSQFLSVTNALLADSGRLLATEYNDLQTLTASVECKAAVHVLNSGKNRSPSVIPGDRNRVKLNTKGGMTDDYINASLITIPSASVSGVCSYIATQHPLHDTVADFWQMVWERNVSFVVMLNSPNNENIPYWPPDESCSKSYGQISVKVVTCISSGERSLFRLMEVAKGKKVKNIKQFQFQEWTSYSEQHCRPLFDFFNIMRSNTDKTKSSGPIVLHCSDGGGRTGVYLAVLHIISVIQRGDPTVDVFGIVKSLMESRMNIIETEEQFSFIYDCVKVYLSERRDREARGAKTDPYETTHYYTNTSFREDGKDVYEKLP